MCEPKALWQARPMPLPGGPPSQPPIEVGGGEAAGEARIAAEHRHPEGERLEPGGAGELVDEAFGEKQV